MDLSGPGQVPNDPTTLATRPEPTWVGPIADSNLAASLDPADTAVMRESIRLAFITALQVLPPVAVYHDAGAVRWEPFAIHLLDTAGGRISAITHFVCRAVFAEFGLPDEVVEQVAPSA